VCEAAKVLQGLQSHGKEKKENNMYAATFAVSLLGEM
jgi:hypothetical protein